jgi:hypothetical protein
MKIILNLKCKIRLTHLRKTYQISGNTIFEVVLKQVEFVGEYQLKTVRTNLLVPP